MPLPKLTYNSLTTAVVTVCVDAPIADELLSLIGHMPWTVTSSRLETHVSATRRPAFGQQMQSADACIAFVDFDMDPAAAVETTKYLLHTFTRKLVVVGLAASSAQDVLLLAMRAGCVEFLHKPLDRETVQEAFTRIQASWFETQQKTIMSGSVLSFVGAKGGVGTTTLAVHLGSYLAQSHKKRTLLVDLHPELGHVCVYLGIDGAGCNFHDVVRNVNRLDSELLNGFVVKHSSGLDVLSSPDTFGARRAMDLNAVLVTLKFLKSEYDFVLFDCAHPMNDLEAAVVGVSSSVYLVATPEVGAIRDLSRYTDRLMQMEDMADKLRVVANRFPAPYTVSLQQMERAIRMPITWKFNANYTELMEAGNMGEPVAPNAKSEFAASMSTWAASLAGSPAPAAIVKKPGRSFSFWKHSPPEPIREAR